MINTQCKVVYSKKFSSPLCSHQLHFSLSPAGYRIINYWVFFQNFFMQAKKMQICIVISPLSSIKCSTVQIVLYVTIFTHRYLLEIFLYQYFKGFAFFLTFSQSVLVACICSNLFNQFFNDGKLEYFQFLLIHTVLLINNLYICCFIHVHYLFSENENRAKS